MAANVTKADFITRYAKEMGTSKAAALRAYNAFIATLADVMVEEDDFRLPGFAKFSLKPQSRTEYLDPRTGEMMKVDPLPRLGIKSLPAFRDEILAKRASKQRG